MVHDANDDIVKYQRHFQEGHGSINQTWEMALTFNLFTANF